jgi:hypothetical protein
VNFGTMGDTMTSAGNKSINKVKKLSNASGSVKSQAMIIDDKQKGKSHQSSKISEAHSSRDRGSFNKNQLPSSR